MRLKTSPAVRVLPPSKLTGGRWLAENAAEPRRWSVGLATAVTLLSAMREQDRSALVRSVSGRMALSDAETGRLVDRLIGSGLVVAADADRPAEAKPAEAKPAEAKPAKTEPAETEPAEAKADRFEAIRRRWRSYGWTEAAEYHAGTLDYPFLDYADGGRLLDTYRMRGYVESEADTDRYKRYPDAARIPLPVPSAGLAPADVADSLRADPRRPVDWPALASVLSLTFGEVDRIEHGRWQRSPMMRRTSPSGGARHPCEGYVIVLDVPGIDPGAYHVNPSGPYLERVRADVPEPAVLAEIVPIEYHRFDHGISAVIVISCVFARNMYRYREPRTFRTVHNDAGHLAATAAMVAASAGLRHQVEYAGFDQSVEAYLGLDGLTEGFMLTVSLLSPEPSAAERDRRRDAVRPTPTKE